MTLANTGQLPLTIAKGGISLSDSSQFQIESIFSSTQGPISLATAPGVIAPNSGETWTINLVFDPVKAGSCGTQLTISSNDPSQGIAPVSLTGIGLNQPGILVADSAGAPLGQTIAFGNVLNDGPGNRVASQTVTIQNIGAQPLSVPANGVSLSSASGFSIQSIVSSTRGAINPATAASIAPNQGESWTVTLTLDPTANTGYSGTLTIQSNDPRHSAVSSSLSGAGVQPSIVVSPQTAAPALYVQAGQLYNISYTPAYAAGAATVALSTAPTLNATTGLALIATGIPYTTSGSGLAANYAWQPNASLAGQEFYIYGTITDGSVTAGSFSQQKIHVEAANSFNLISPIATATPSYAYQYIWNGKVYAGTTTLNPGQNILTLPNQLPDGTNIVHQITVTLSPTLLATQGYTYDEMNRIKTYTNGNGIVTSYTYDLAGNLVQTSASNGNVVSYTYDT